MKIVIKRIFIIFLFLQMITIHCAWCNSVQPEITKVEWQNLEGKITKNGLVGEPLRLYAETKGIVGDVTFCIYDDKRRTVASFDAKIDGDKASVEWTYYWNGVVLKEKPKFQFEVIATGCKPVHSEKCEIEQKIRITMMDEYSYVLKNTKAILTNGIEKIEKENLDGVFEYYVIPGNWKFITTYLSDTFEYGPYEKELNGKTYFHVHYDTLMFEGIYCTIPDIYIFVEFYKGISSLL